MLPCCSGEIHVCASDQTDAVDLTQAVPNGNGAAFEVDVLPPKGERLADSASGVPEQMNERCEVGIDHRLAR
jgi:hypothetical protein